VYRDKIINNKEGTKKLRALQEEVEELRKQNALLYSELKRYRTNKDKLKQQLKAKLDKL
jgi:FtsZ-binding cell division protein ZapB